MAAVEVLETLELDDWSPAPYLRLITEDPQLRTFVHGPSLARRRAARAKVLRRRRRVLVSIVVLSAVAILAVPGHVFGATTGGGLSTDLANSSDLASGMSYVVQPGDTIASIAREMNPVDPAVARVSLVRELGSDVVVPGEHVLIP
jgi:hypothetical protein